MILCTPYATAEPPKLLAANVPVRLPLDTVVVSDALAFLRGLPDASVDMILTSPPYDNLRTYKGYSWDFEGIAHQSYRVLKHGGVMVWVVGDATINGSETLSSMRQALYFVDCAGFSMHDTMIYEVAGTGAKGSNSAYWQSFEYMFVLSKGKPKTVNLLCDKINVTKGGVSKGRGTNANGESAPTLTITAEAGRRTNIWRFMAGFNFNGNTKHPATFPEALAHDHISSWSNPGDVVCDFFMGSGTTAKMARALNRRYIGCDISSEYVQIAIERLATPYTPDMFARLDTPAPLPIQEALL
jgi:DNA modification methylase